MTDGRRKGKTVYSIDWDSEEREAKYAAAETAQRKRRRAIAQTAVNRSYSDDDSDVQSFSFDEEDHPWYDRLKNSATHWFNELNRMAVGSKRWEIQQNTFAKEDLEKIQRLRDLEDVNLDTADPAVKQAVTEEKKNLQKYLLENGRQHDELIDLLFDKSRVNDIDIALQYLRGGRNLYQDFANSAKTVVDQSLKLAQLKNNPLYAISKAAEVLSGDNVGEKVGNFVQNRVNVAENILSPVTTSLNTIARAGFSFFTSPEEKFRQVLKEQDQDGRLAMSTFKGFDPIYGTEKDTGITQQEIDDVSKTLDEKQKLLQTELELKEEDEKLGRVFSGFDPIRIDPKVDDWWNAEEQEYGKNPINSFSKWDHMLASTASTASFMRYQIPQMGLEVATSWLIKKYGTDAVLGGGKSFARQALTKGLGAVTLGYGIKTAVDSREAETGIEALEAYQDRVLNDAVKNGADYNKVVESVKQQLEERGVNTKGKDSEQLLKDGILYGIQTGDMIWDASVDHARLGLNKLINQNNALAGADFIEMLPYMPYTGSMISKSIKRSIFEKAVLRNRAARGITRTASNEAMERLWGSSKVQEKIAKSIINPGGFVQSKIDDAAKFFVKKDAPKAALWFRDISKYAINRLPFAFGSSIKEGIEEGQQELLHNRYMRGEYDSYTRPETMFDTAEMLSALDLAGDAIANYIGVGVGDVDNGSQDLRKAMNIGFASSWLFSNVRHAANNINFLNADQTNVRELIKNLKTSNTIGQLVARNYEVAQDYQHAGIFYEALKKGKSAEQLKDRLQFLYDSEYQLGNESAITKDMVDADKLLIDNVNAMYHNKDLQNLLKDHGKKLYGPLHRWLILDGATRRTDLDKNNELRMKQNKEISNMDNTLRNRFAAYIEAQSDEERQALLATNPELEQLSKNFEDIYDQYIQLNVRDDLHKKASSVIRQFKQNGDITQARQKLIGLNMTEDAADDLLDAAANGEDISTYKIQNASAAKIDRVSYVKALYNQYLAYENTRILDDAISLSNNAVELQNFIRKHTGLDLNTTNLKGIVKELKRIKKAHNENLKKNGLDLSQHNTVFTNGQYDWDLNDDNIVSRREKVLSFFINGGLLGPQRTAAAPYQFGAVSVNRIRQAVYGEDLQEDNEFGDLLKVEQRYNQRVVTGQEFSKLNKEQRNKAIEIGAQLKQTGDITEARNQFEQLNLNSDAVEEVIDYLLDGGSVQDLIITPKSITEVKEKMEKNNKDAAWKYMMNRAREAEKRTRIARRGQIEDAYESAGVEHTEEDVENVASAQETPRRTPQRQSTSDRETSAAERDLRQRYLNENVSQEERRQRQIDERREELRRREEGSNQNQEGTPQGDDEQEEQQERQDRQQTQGGQQPQRSGQQEAEDFLNDIIPGEDDSQAGAEGNQSGSGSGLVDQLINPAPVNTGGLENAEPEPAPEGAPEGTDEQKSIQDVFLRSNDPQEIVNFILAELGENDYGERSFIDDVNPTDEQGIAYPPIVAHLSKKKHNNQTLAVEVKFDNLKTGSDMIRRIVESGRFVPDGLYDPENDIIGQIRFAVVNGKPVLIQAEAKLKNGRNDLLRFVPEGREDKEAQVQAALEEQLSVQEMLQQQAEENEAAEQREQEENQEQELQERDIQEAAAQEQISQLEKWVKIDNFSMLDVDEDGNMLYGDTKLSQEQAQYIRVQLRLLGMTDSGQLDQNAVPMNKNMKKFISSEYLGNWLANTFFYAVDDANKNVSLADRDGNGDIIDPKMFNGVVLPKEIGTAAELSSKLSNAKWLKNVKKYYIVTKSKYVEGALKDKIEDAFTVTMVLEDNEKCYLTFLRDLGQGHYTDEDGKKQKWNNELKWRNWLITKNADIVKIEEELAKEGKSLSTDPEKRTEEISLFLAQKTKEACYNWYTTMFHTEVGFESWYSPDGPVTNNNKAQRDASRAIIAAWKDQILRIYALDGRYTMDKTAADEQIAKLRQLRHDIISKYCYVQDGNYIFPDKVRTDIEPEYVSQSNGKINNMKDAYGGPVFRSVTSPTATIEDIEKDIESGTMAFGYGKGFAASGEANYEIRGVMNDSQIFDGKGLSGKIYLMVPSKALNDEPVPIMLSEQRFDTQVREKDGNQETRHDIVQCLSVVNGKVTNVSGNKNGYSYRPSAAEVLLYMVCKQGEFSQLTDDQIEFFIHHGQDTLLGNKDRQHWANMAQQDRFLFSTLTSKQISWDYNETTGKYELTIGLLNQDGIGYTTEIFTQDQLFADTEEAANLRQICIEAIARQMHWNTDVKQMKSSIHDTGIVQFAVDNYRQGDSEVIEICGCPQLSFNMRDTHENGHIRPTNTTAWMLKTGRLMTDVGTPMFKDPYVFAEGVNSVSTPPGQGAANGEGESADETLQNPFLDPQKIGTELEDYGLCPSDSYEEWFAKDKNSRKEILEKLNKGKSTKIHDLILIQQNPEELDDVSEESIKEALYDLVKRVKTQYEKYSGLKFDDSDIVMDESIYSESMYDSIFKTYNNDNNPEYKIQLKFYTDKNGKNKVVVNLHNEETVGKNNIYTGVFSSVQQKPVHKGSLNETQARQWLFDKLGIKGYNIIVQRGAILGANDELAYGATNLAVDAITGQLVARFNLSQMYGSKGVQYHEAWHYVNLLLHNKDQRESLYMEYAKYHKNLQNATYQEIEEAMAEDFLSYAENKMDNSIVGKIKKFFKNVMSFLGLVNNQRLYRQIYDEILSGGYRFAKINEQSAIDFINTYQAQALSIDHKVSGLSEELRSKLKSINSYQELFEVVDSCINNVLVTANIDSVEGAKRFAKKDGISKIVNDVKNRIKNLKDQYEGEDEDAIPTHVRHQIDVLTDIVNNPDIIHAQLASRFQNMGFKVSFRNRNQENENVVDEEVVEKRREDATKAEDRHDNTWDQLDITLSRKNNASTRVKLFLSTIPMYKDVLDASGNAKFVPQLDKFGSQRLWDQDQAWNAIVEILAECRTYDELRRIVKKKAKHHALFYSINQKLSRLDDPRHAAKNSAIKSELFGIFNAHKNNIQTVNLSDPFEQQADDFTEGSEGDITESKSAFTSAVADVNKTWTLSGDGVYGPTITLPMRWSQWMASNGLTETSTASSDLVISSNFVTGRDGNGGVYGLWQSIDNDFTNAGNKLRGLRKPEEKAAKYKEVVKKVSVKLIRLYNSLGIPMDVDVLHAYIQNTMSTQDNTPKERYKALKQIATAGGSGSLRDIMEMLHNNIGKSEVMVGNKTKAIDELLTGFGPDSAMGKLALAYAQVHPQLREISAKSANNDTLYPINMNNFLSDTINQANQDKADWANAIQKSAYCHNSIIADAARLVNDDITETKLRLNTFVGMKQITGQAGADYLDITPTEDYLAKMFLTENDNLIFPTMADKKTWYSISVGTSSAAIKKQIGSHTGFKLSHDTIIAEPRWGDFIASASQVYQNMIEEYDEAKHGSLQDFNNTVVKDWYQTLKKDREANADILNEIDLGARIYAAGNVQNYRRFGDATLRRFARYFFDELDAVRQYYSVEHVKNLVENPNQLIDNFHGKIENGKLLFGGNGGLFRYFYDIAVETGIGGDYNLMEVSDSFNSSSNNINQQLQALYVLQQNILSGEGVKNALAKEGDPIQNVTVDCIPNDTNGEHDGFELIRMYLDQLHKTLSENPEILYSAINDKLIALADAEMKKLADEDSALHLIKINPYNKQYIPDGIPVQFLEPYMKELRSQGYAGTGTIYGQGGEQGDVGVTNALYSLIANYVVNCATSVIEVEKIFSGDPAFYKWSNKEDKDRKPVTQKVTIQYQIDDNTIAEDVIDANIMQDNFGDKIKRLGGTLSPGTELRLDFSQTEIDDDIKTISQHIEDPEQRKAQAVLGTDKYTVLDVEDVKCPSEVFDSIVRQFEKQSLIDLVRCDKIQINENKQDLIERLYNDDNAFDKFYKSVQDQQVEEQTIDGNQSISVKDIVDREVKAMSDPYSKITVADAQVIIRPAMYRKIRIALGDWTKADEEAYWILEKDDSWIHDAEKCKKVKKFQQYVLKMSYFGNDPSMIGGVNINIPLYNKMAIFPLFKFQRSTDVGEKIYNRMNQSGNELDMIAFKSAVKVGGTKNAIHVVDKNASVKDGVSKLNELLNQESDKALNYQNGVVTSRDVKNRLSVKVQNLHNLRLQLNTKAHEDDIRAIGTQMFKIAFSNVFDKDDYNGRTGKEIREEIMNCIEQLTQMGVDKIHAKYYDRNEDGSYTINEEKVKNKMLSILESNGLGEVARQILESSGVASSLASRSVFEQSISKFVNSEVVDISTNGGTAVQQSVFGYEGYQNVVDDSIVQYNDGNHLEWDTDNGSMEVLLSIKFFKTVVPPQFQISHEIMRQWLINHDIINGVKKSIPTFTYHDKEYDDINPEWEQKQVWAEPKPFGIGYRIPTQGMSSMFVMTVADVLPEETGDLIIVPREFTAQTGSDFDIDKLYIAKYSYKNGVLEGSGEGEITKGAITNKLLSNYIEIISNNKNYGQSRGAIDVYTDMLKHNILPELQDDSDEYLEGASQLTPSFQTFRKMEFSTGKKGISPFALNIPHLALVQHVHITIDFGNNPFELLPLDQPYGKDGRLISGWLSAMINAHVDVAKDPYIFALNVNQATYNMTNFLLRTGNGLATFAFMAQPAIKIYAQKKNNKGGIYGKDLYGTEQSFFADAQILSNVTKIYVDRLKGIIDQIGDQAFKEKCYQVYMYYKTQLENAKKSKANRVKVEKPKIKWSEVISLADNVKSLRNLKSGMDQKTQQVTDPNSLAAHYMHQLLCLEAFSKLSSNADALSKMVQASRIDTKKFGNDIVTQMIYLNKVNNFRYNNSTAWTISTPEFQETVPLSKDGKPDKNAIAQKALNEYFDKLFLGSKLEKATNLTKQLCASQLLTATPAFEEVFKRIMQRMYGEAIFEDVSGGFQNKKVVGTGWQDKIYNPQNPIAMAKALDNLFRFNALFNWGTSIYEDEVNRNPNTEMIDLTLGGNKQAIAEKMRNLYFGGEGKANIFARVRGLMADMKADPKKMQDGKRKYAGLVDNTGNIINDLLLYLQPLLASNKYPIGRMMLAESQMDVPGHMKQRYVSAFYQLLSHSDEEIREVAKDLVIFAYYSQYDQNTPGSFFDLVPPEYRAQYDQSLREVLQHLNNPKVGKNAVNILTGVDSEDALLDIISRNYWYNNDVVADYNYHDDEYDWQNPKNIFDFNSGETTIGGESYDPRAKWSFPGGLISNKVPQDKLFIKLSHNGVSYLYKKVATITRDSKKNPGKAGQPYYVYIAVPKAGYRQKGVVQYEFYADYESDSIFGQNMLPAAFAEDVLKKAVESRIDSYNSVEGQYKLTLEDWEETPITRLSTNTNAYIQIDAQDSNAAERSVDRTTLQFTKGVNANPDRKGQNNADVIINITTDDTNDRTYNIQESCEGKTINIKIGKKLSDSDLQKIQEIINSNPQEGEAERTVTIHLSTPMRDFQILKQQDNLPKSFKNKIDSEVKKLIKERLKNYKEELVEQGDLSKEQIDDLMELRRLSLTTGDLNPKVVRQASQNVTNEYISTLLQNIANGGVNIGTLTTAASKEYQVLAKAASYTMSLGNREVSGIDNIVHINRQFPSSPETMSKYAQFVRSLQSIYQQNKPMVEETNNEKQDAKLEAEIRNDINAANQAVASSANNVVDTSTAEAEVNPLLEESQKTENSEEAQNKKCDFNLGAFVSAEEDFNVGEITNNVGPITK